MNAEQIYRATEYTEVLPQLDEGLRPWRDLTAYLRHYAREKPVVVALWCFGIGFVLGWKLKPW